MIARCMASPPCRRLRLLRSMKALTEVVKEPDSSSATTSQLRLYSDSQLYPVYRSVNKDAAIAIATDIFLLGFLRFRAAAYVVIVCVEDVAVV